MVEAVADVATPDGGDGAVVVEPVAGTPVEVVVGTVEVAAITVADGGTDLVDAIEVVDSDADVVAGEAACSSEPHATVVVASDISAARRQIERRRSRLVVTTRPWTRLFAIHRQCRRFATGDR
jgi:hypothetical protein